MGEFFDEIPEKLIVWILKQQMFWVATAPLKADGHVNVSPKGLEGSFHIVDSHRVWYEDLTGSGSETIAHLRENGRITVLFNAFEGPPRIARLFGRGTVHEYDSPEYNRLLPPSIRKPGSRAVIVIDVYKVGTSCGYAVPYYDFKGHRSQLLEMSVRKQDADRDAELAMDPTSSTPPRPQKGLKWYWAERNKHSLDGLPAMLSAPHSLRVFEPVTTKFKKDNNAEPGALTKQASSTTASTWLDLRLVLAFIFGLFTATIYIQFLPRISSTIFAL